MAALYDYKVGDFVWAKMKGFAPWPARICESTAILKGPTERKGKHPVFFYGSDNYAWIPEDCIWPYEEFSERYRQPLRATKQFQEALETLAAELKANPAATPPKKLGGASAAAQASPTAVSPAAKSTSSARKAKTLKEESKDDSHQASGSKRASSTSATSFAHPGSSKRTRLLDKHMSRSPKAKRSTDSPAYNMEGSSSGKHDGDGIMSSHSMMSEGSSFLPDILPSPSDHVVNKNIMPTPLKIGFLGIGIMGSGMVENLLKSGHEVTIWNRNNAKCRDLVNEGALKGNNPADVVHQCDLIFSCVSDGPALKDLVYGNCGVLQSIGPGKRFVDLSTVDVESIQDVNDAIVTRGGKFLEAPVIGTKELAKRGQVLVLASGDKTVYDDCHSCFQAIGRHMMFLGEIASATRMKLVLSLLIGTTLSGLAESLALADKLGLSTEDVLKVFNCTSASSPFLRDKGADMIHNRLAEPSCKLQIMAKDLRLAVNMSDTVDQPLHVGAAVCELFKKAKAKGYGEHDVAAVYRAADL